MTDITITITTPITTTVPITINILRTVLIDLIDIACRALKFGRDQRARATLEAIKDWDRVWHVEAGDRFVRHLSVMVTVMVCVVFMVVVVAMLVVMLVAVVLVMAIVVATAMVNSSPVSGGERLVGSGEW